MIDQERLRQQIDQAILGDPQFNGPFEIRMSTAGFCPRLMDYLMQVGRKPVSLEHATRMLIGEPLHEFWRRILTKVYEDDYHRVEEEVTLQVGGHVVYGHPDGVIQSLNAVVEVKSVSEATFYMVERQGHPIASHYEQGNIYAKATGCEWIVFLYINRNSGGYTVLVAPFSASLAEETWRKWAGRWENHARFVKDGNLVLAPRPYADATGSPCFFCEYQAECYAGFKDEVEGMDSGVVLDDEVNSMATDYRSTRELRLKTEKVEEQLKDRIAEYMTGQRLNRMAIPYVGSFHLKVGKNNNPLVNFKPAEGDDDE